MRGAITEICRYTTAPLRKQRHELTVAGVEDRVRAFVADRHVAQQHARHQALGRVGLDRKPSQLADGRQAAIGPDHQPRWIVRL